ncbi:helix-turn-helix transcriptional regulator [Ornithinimicrobium faecis]|uniref:Helix-turn-helix transcriptional regulator n=1 Tax=Ornithinimicrobium faecis TaxID=2934158 RepID=A0ABY4YSC0_9MICO|nr:MULTISPECIES: helix-turn-helix transcriptional regulator [unclassified Ornithinimicrobium]USQ79663.1 helix-turn-helix transcriptional regulator [Ornithinimicrobium sp. HY1793]
MPRLDDLADPQFEDYLSSLYLTMLRIGRPTREALVDSGLHPEDVDRAAAFLVGRQLITPIGPGVWDILPPETAMPRLAASLEARARSTRNTASELGALWRQARTTPDEPAFVGVEMLRSVEQVVLAAHSLSATAQERLRYFMDDSPASRRLLQEEDPSAVVQPSVPPSAMSMVVDVALFNHEGVLPRLEAMANSGQRILVGDGLPFGGLVVDDKSALVDLSRHDPRADGSFVVRRRAAVAAVGALFDVAFELSTPMAPTLARVSGESDEAPLEARDRRILSLLAAGATDQQIARSVGVSKRTVERRVAAIMQTLSAGTRFQAGVQAARRDWI